MNYASTEEELKTDHTHNERAHFTLNGRQLKTDVIFFKIAADVLFQHKEQFQKENVQNRAAKDWRIDVNEPSTTGKQRERGKERRR